jgi:DNA-binding response OmpR family regulator
MINHPKRRRILVIDDDSEMRSGIKLLMDRKGFTVSGAKTAAEAKGLVLSSIKSHLTCYDLIILDVALGSKSGLALLADLRALAEIDVPVMVISGSFDGECVKRAVALGIKDFVVKPFGAYELQERILKVLDGREKSAAL